MNEWKLKLKYVYNWVWVKWFDTYSWTVSDFFRETIIYEDKNFYKTFPILGDFFKLNPPQQVNIVCSFLLALILLILLTTFILLRCICRCCCKKVPKSSKVVVNSRDREKID